MSCVYAWPRYVRIHNMECLHILHTPKLQLCVDAFWQLRYAHRQWGAELTQQGRNWLAKHGLTAEPPPAPAAPAAPAAGSGAAMPFTDMAAALPNPGTPFPNPWSGVPAGSMANLGIRIPPSVRPIGAGGTIHIDTTAGGAGSQRPPSVPPPGLEACFQWGYALGSMQNENRQLRDRVGWLEAQAIEDTSSQPTSMGFLFFCILKLEGILK